MRKVRQSVEQLWEEYLELGTFEALGRRYGVTERTLRRYFREAGYAPVEPGPKPAHKGTAIPPHHRSCLAEWIREHPGTKLPKGIRAIADLTGCSYATVNSYLSRRRNAIKKRLEALPPLKELSIPLPDVSGRIVNTSYFQDVEKKLDPWTLKVHLRVNIGGGSYVRFIFDIGELEDLIEEHREGSQHPPQATSD